MIDREISIEVVLEVAAGLKELKSQVIFVGGAVVGLYADDLGAEEIRETKDVDITLGLLNYSDWSKLQDKLATLGFHPDPFGSSVCRYKYKGIPIDIMTSLDSPLGPSNRWYKVGFNHLNEVELKGEKIQILPAPIYLATKFEAFNNRGTDYRTSHDFEDIIFVIDNRLAIVQETEESPDEVKEFLKSEIEKILNNSLLEEIVSSHINPLTYGERFPLIIEKMTRITKIR